MYQFILLIHVFIAILLVALVLVQQGKGATMGAAFGAGASQTIFGSRGSGSFLFRFTISLAALFFISSIFLNYLTMSAYKHANNNVLPFTMPTKEMTQPLTKAPVIPTIPAKTVPAPAFNPAIANPETANPALIRPSVAPLPQPKAAPAPAAVPQPKPAKPKKVKQQAPTAPGEFIIESPTSIKTNAAPAATQPAVAPSTTKTKKVKKQKVQAAPTTQTAPTTQPTPTKVKPKKVKQQPASSGDFTIGSND